LDAGTGLAPGAVVAAVKGGVVIEAGIGAAIQKLEQGRDRSTTGALIVAAKVGSNSRIESLQYPCIRELPGRHLVESTSGWPVYVSKIPKQKQVSI
jgi:hypothetical protein